MLLRLQDPPRLQSFQLTSYSSFHSLGFSFKNLASAIYFQLPLIIIYGAHF